MDELALPSISRVNLVISLSVVLALAAYSSVAISGYVTFGSRILPDVLQEYPSTVAFSLARIGLASTAVFSVPLQAHPARRCFLSLAEASRRAARTFIRGDKESEGRPVHQPLMAEPQAPSDRHDVRGLTESEHAICYWGFTLTFVGVTWIVAANVTNLGKVMAMVGATGSSSVSYILPGLLYFKLHPRRHIKRYLALLLLVAGLVIMPISIHAILAPAVAR